jgi:two-component system, sporulation sensor kinase E
MENFIFQSEKLLTVGQLAASVTHEIRNPLTSLKGFIQLLRTSGGQTEYPSKYLDIMLKELKQIETFVDELSVLAKAQVKSYKKTNIISLLQDTLSLLKTQALTNNVYIKCEHESVRSVFCEEKQLRQALFNVIQNGIEAMPDGGILYVRIKLYDESYLKIEVTDHGMGIPEDRLLKLGEPFYSTKEKGTGLGLTLTYKIIENHQGKITIQSQVGCGTTVTILLPVTKQNIEQAMIG